MRAPRWTGKYGRTQHTQFDDHKLRAGAVNLLVDCVGVEANQRLLVLHENPRHGYYDEGAPLAVAREARALGAQVQMLEAPLIAGPEALPPAIRNAIEYADHTVFFSRIGDQLRFRELSGAGTKTMCYALDAELLASDFCTVPHGLFERVLHRLQDELDHASRWRMTCPLGTDVTGQFEPTTGATGAGDSFTLGLFPIVTFNPVSCRSMHGRVSLAHWLMSTGTHSYDDDVLMIDRPITAIVDRGRIVDFLGDHETVTRVRSHYERVSTAFGIDPWVVHSWHAGVNPKTFYPRDATENIERWGGVTFGSPRYTHFHTCGDYSPGEIAWSLFDTTIYIDDEVYWQDGILRFLEREDIQSLSAEYPGIDHPFAMRTDIGVKALG